MYQPPDPEKPNTSQNFYSDQTQGYRFQQPYPQFSQFQTSPTPPQKPPKPPLFDYKARKAYFKQYPPSKKYQAALGCGLVAGLLALCALCGTIVTASTSTQQAAQTTPTTASQQQAVIATSDVSTPTQKPTMKPTAAKPTQKPVQKPAVIPTKPPAPVVHTGVNGNPWGYDFNPGSLIYSPNAAFCDYFSCVSTFWSKANGYVVECGNGEYSHSGGVRGACSRDGGVARALYSH